MRKSTAVYIKILKSRLFQWPRRSRRRLTSAPRKAKPFAEINSGVYKKYKNQDFFSGHQRREEAKAPSRGSEAICGKEQRSSVKPHKFLFFHPVTEKETNKDSRL
ncbi:hypothetical protein AAV98_01735 [Bacillus sp. CHD6a]|nr:hypothetical protein AAV98_01735 [Bacillus sp. CHD6a]